MNDSQRVSQGTCKPVFAPAMWVRTGKHHWWPPSWWLHQGRLSTLLLSCSSCHSMNPRQSLYRVDVCKLLAEMVQQLIFLERHFFFSIPAASLLAGCLD